MFYSGILTDGSKKDADLREAAPLRQQRRMKQSVQFIHKDSADLLPLDGLKRLGTSKDTQPHNILQRRLLETNLSKIRTNSTSWTSKSELSTHSNKFNHTKCERKVEEEEELIFVWCQSAGITIKTLIDTSCQYNLISSACLDRLGLKEHFRSYRKEDEGISLPYNVRPIGKIEHLAVTLSTATINCAAVVIDDNEKLFSIGLQTLRSIKCLINLEKNQLEFGSPERGFLPFIPQTNDVKEERSSDA
ncbi:nuclear receptor-interacting protein 3 isoform X1 [Pelobates fuscus]|uniref:nuclear receptor-interacting protein 3 isoform X1 n=2 Tax=Pelobates fuscus TaxID=191477 RepID=UPI002FE4BC91